jgi:hypothetical protein
LGTLFIGLSGVESRTSVSNSLKVPLIALFHMRLVIGLIRGVEFTCEKGPVPRSEF